MNQPSEFAQRVWSAVGCGDDESLMQCVEIESAIESIGECSEIGNRVLSEVESMVTLTQTGIGRDVPGRCLSGSQGTRPAESVRNPQICFVTTTPKSAIPRT